MATETEKIYNGSISPTAPATVNNSVGGATSSYITGNTSLDNYNATRLGQINNMYNAQRDSALNQLETAHNRNLSDAQAAYDKISPQYQQSRNAVGAEYERQRRNNNMQAAANGLNTGAGSQMQLAASNVYQQNQAGLQKAENEALNEANRNMLSMREQYQADVSKALSDNDATRAAALLNEYGQQYDRMSEQAKQLAAYGDFSLYKTIYGDAAANQMEQTWLLQNPQLAYTLGKITADQYFKMTGTYPPDVLEAMEEEKKKSKKSYYGYGGSKKSNDKKDDKKSTASYMPVMQAIRGPGNEYIPVTTYTAVKPKTGR